ncbi:MAG: hypothetical protein KJ048_00105 [Dehalococcoidia bacterium]|nr:hypothetical protein [Dehalococcoidia bacterium]
MKDSQSHGPGPVEPLTHRNADDELYQRNSAVEQQIAAALALRPEPLLERVTIADAEGDEYLQEECLVYLIRHYHRMGETGLVSDLSAALLRRCAKLIDGHLSRLGGEAARDGYNDVVERLFAPILDLDSNRGDFLQVRFWPALERLAVRAFNQQLTLHKRDRAAVSLSSLPGYDRDGDEEPEWVARPRDHDAVTSPSGEMGVINDALIRDALSRIDEPFRSAFLLRHYFDWPIEHQDPAVRTISRHFAKDPRTIRNWLKKAEESLQTWRGEQR